MLTGYWIDGKSDLTMVYHLRTKIFGLDTDEMDPWARHLVVFDEDEPVAVGSLIQNLHHIYELYHVGVVEHKRRQRIGAFTVKVLMTDVWERDGVSLELIATKESEVFFHRAGFLTSLEPGKETGTGRSGIYMFQSL